MLYQNRTRGTLLVKIKDSNQLLSYNSCALHSKALNTVLHCIDDYMRYSLYEQNKYITIKLLEHIFVYKYLLNNKHHSHC